MAQKTSKKAIFDAFLKERGFTAIGEAEMAELTRFLAPISENYLRSLAREIGLPLAPLVEGIRQENFEELERTLRAMLIGYESGPRECRRLVWQAKDHARWWANSPKATEETRRMKLEMVEWMLVWLENPPLFPIWVDLRKGFRSKALDPSA